MEVTWSGVHDAAGVVKENCWEMRCEVKSNEDRKLDRAALCGVNCLLRRHGRLIVREGYSILRSDREASGLKVIGSGVPLPCAWTLAFSARSPGRLKSSGDWWR